MSTDFGSITTNLPDRYDRLRVDAAVVYTADPDRPVVPGGSILVEGAVITAVGTAAEVDRAEAASSGAHGRYRRIDATNRMVLPGLVNDHWHEVGSLRAASGLSVDVDDAGTESGPFAHGGDMRGLTLFFDGFWDLVPLIPEDLKRLAALDSYVSQLRAGTTCVADFGSVNQPEVLADAVLASGIRGVVTAYGVDGVCHPAESTFKRTRDTGEILVRQEALLRRFGRHECGRLRAMPSVLSGLGASDELITGSCDLAARYDTPLATHISAAANEPAANQEYFGVRPVERWHRLGSLSDRVVSAHTAFADEQELAWLIDAGVHVTHSPQRYGATGEMTITKTKQVLRFLEADARISLSTDGDPLPLGFMPESMKMAWLTYNEAAGDPSTVTPMRALGMATLAGAKALRWDDEIGSLAPGKKADLVTVPVDDFRYAGIGRPLQSFLSMGSSGDVDMVVVDGRILVEDRTATFVDERALSAAFLAASSEFARGMGQPPG